MNRSSVVEWIENGIAGIEHGFTVSSRPAGSGTLVVALTLGGGFRSVLSPDSRTVEFYDSSDELVFLYRDLAATDSSGVSLQASFSIRRGVLSIEVDDTKATYPVTIDPLLATGVWQTKGVGDDDFYGFAVAGVGDVTGNGYGDVAVGAPNYDTDGILDNEGVDEEGAVFIYQGGPSGLGTTPVWVAYGGDGTSGQNGQRFGHAVACAGDYDQDGKLDLAVGAPGYDSSAVDAGRVYLFKGPLNTGGPVLTANEVITGAFAGEQLGTAVASADLTGDGYADLAVGAPGWKNAANEPVGAVMIYHSAATGFPSSPSQHLEGELSYSRFGQTLSNAGDVDANLHEDLLVGAPGYDCTAAPDAGRAYAYYAATDGSGVQATPDWYAETCVPGAQLGISVTRLGDPNQDGYSDIAVGARALDSSGALGTVIVWAGGASGLGATGSLLNFTWLTAASESHTHFAEPVALAGDVNGDSIPDLLIGASLEEFDATLGYEGRVHLFHGNGCPYDPLAKPTQTINNKPVTNETTNFGHSIFSAGDINGDGYSDVIIGSWRQDDGTKRDAGRAVVLRGARSRARLNFSEEFQPVTGPGDSATDAAFGSKMSWAGDINGDGYTDLVVASPEYDYAGLTDSGRIYVHYGSSAGYATTPDWVCPGTGTGGSDCPYAGTAGENFGSAVAYAGDVNGDGYGDLLVGASGADTGAGKAYLYFGSACGLETAACTAPLATWVKPSPFSGSSAFGFSVASAGDVNGDGYSDILIGAPFYQNGGAAVGRAVSYYGSSLGLLTEADWDVTGSVAGGRFGYSVATAGDPDRNGMSDVVIGDPWYSGGQSEEGRVYVYYAAGSPPYGLQAAPGWTAESDVVGAHFGWSVAHAGDINRDGYSDVVIGAPDLSDGQTAEGSFSTYLGSATGLSATVDLRIDSNAAGAKLGFAVSSGGDMNGDGYGDILVGEPEWANGQTREGRALCYAGGAEGLSSTILWSVEADYDEALLGQGLATVAGAVVVGAPGTTGASIQNRVRVYYPNYPDGTEAFDPCLPVFWMGAQQTANSGGNQPIALLGGHRPPVVPVNSFNLKLTARTPLGRGRVAVEYEVCDMSTPFGGATTRTAFVPTDPPVPGLGSVKTFDIVVTAPSTGPMKWRARVLTEDPLFPVLPWHTMEGNGDLETDLVVTAAP